MRPVKFRTGKAVSTDLNPRKNRNGSGSLSSRINGGVSFSCEYLVIAGGGAGSDRAGGAGAGGYRNSTSGELTGGGGSAEEALKLLTGNSYSVIIGAGSATIGYPSFNGSNSTFSTITSTGGAGAGIYGGYFTDASNYPGGSGSGGEGFGSSNPGQTRVTNPIQGNLGGIPATANNAEGDGGGGGAGAVGSDAAWNRGGNGGAGLASSITGSSVTRAGGGGGGGNNTSGGYGYGGLGGGTSGRNDGTPASDGCAANTGAGGGGAYWGTGGSGIVIVRYPNTRTISVGAGLTASTVTSGSNKVTSITAGAGTVKFS